MLPFQKGALALPSCPRRGVRRSGWGGESGEEGFLLSFLRKEESSWVLSLPLHFTQVKWSWDTNALRLVIY